LPKQNYFSIEFEKIATFLTEKSQSLKSSTTSDQNIKQLNVETVHCNKNKYNKNKIISSSTTFESEGDRTTSRKGGFDLDDLDKSILSAYNAYVDADYNPVKGDLNKLIAFERKQQLLDIIYLWPYYIGDKGFSDDVEQSECKGHLSKWEKKSTAQILVIIDKFNHFNKWAKAKKESIARKEENLRLMDETNRKHGEGA